MPTYKPTLKIVFVVMLAGLYLFVGEGSSVQAQGIQKPSPFALPAEKGEQRLQTQMGSSASSSVFRLPDKKEMKQESPFALPGTGEDSPAGMDPAPRELPDQPAELFREATAAARQGRYEEAGKMYTRLLQIDPTNVKAMNNLGLVLKKLGRNEEALQAYRYAIQTDSSYPLTYKNIGVLLEEMHDKNGAIQAYETYIGLAPEAKDAAAVQQRMNWLSQ